jgi:hypothetical protein
MAISAKIEERAAEKAAELKKYLRARGYSTSQIEVLSKSVEFAFERLPEFTKKFEEKEDSLWKWASKPVKGPKVRAAEEIDKVVY